MSLIVIKSKCIAQHRRTFLRMKNRSYQLYALTSRVSHSRDCGIDAQKGRPCLPYIENTGRPTGGPVCFFYWMNTALLGNSQGIFCR